MKIIEKANVMDKAMKILDDIWWGDLTKYVKTVSEAHEFRSIIENVDFKGYSFTISENIKNLCQKIGFKVETYGIGWKITL